MTATDKYNLISVDHDVEGWIAPFVLKKAGYEIANIFWLNIHGNKWRDNKNASSLDALWHDTKHAYPVILCTHSYPYKGVVTRLPTRRQEGLFVTHETFFQPHGKRNVMAHLWTCFCDFYSGQPTDYINLPGFDHHGNPGYFTVLEYYKSCKYRKWLGIVMQHHQRYPHKSVDTLFLDILTPRLQKYEKTSKQPWSFVPIALKHVAPEIGPPHASPPPTPSQTSSTRPLDL
jgi:hypothetical protein